MQNAEIKIKIENLGKLAASLQKLFSEATARRRAYRKSIQGELDRRDEFKLKLWRWLYADPNDDSKDPKTGIEFYDPAKVNEMAANGDYAELDEMNRSIAPLMKQYHLLKAVEKEAEKKFNDADWEYGYMVKKYRKQVNSPQGSLF